MVAGLVAPALLVADCVLDVAVVVLALLSELFTVVVRLAAPDVFALVPVLGSTNVFVPASVGRSALA